MKISKYNHYYNCDGEIFLYNTRTSALANMEKEKFEILSRFIKENTSISDSEFLKSLEYGGFVIPDIKLLIIKHLLVKKCLKPLIIG